MVVLRCWACLHESGPDLVHESNGQPDSPVDQLGQPRRRSGFVVSQKSKRPASGFRSCGLARSGCQLRQVVSSNAWAIVGDLIEEQRRRKRRKPVAYRQRSPLPRRPARRRLPFQARSLHQVGVRCTGRSLFESRWAEPCASAALSASSHPIFISASRAAHLAEVFVKWAQPDIAQTIPSACR